MENKQSPSKKKLLSIQEEKLIREIDYDSLARGSTRLSKKQLLLDLEILRKRPTHRPVSQRVLVSIKPRAPAIKTLYIAEKNRFDSKKVSENSGSRLAIGDHSSYITRLTPEVVTSVACGTDQENTKSDGDIERASSISVQVESSTLVPKCSDCNSQPYNIYNIKQRSAERCYVYTQQPVNMNLPKLEAKANTSWKNKGNISTLIVTNTSSEVSASTSITIIKTLNKIIDHLERKILRREIILRANNPNIHLPSSDEDSDHNIMKSTSELPRPGCSYIQQYSHIPETSAFQRYAQQNVPFTHNKATTLEKEHNSEQYGRDFTTYDGITARGRRQCASVPCKRDDIPKQAAERVHKIRHKLNPVRDYRLMDTVHYLAQGEFAPRDDGIKLTPSREAVLSDIIWEDVCRTHWPNARLGRRVVHTERYNTRSDLQRLIDSLLRERVAHVERRRRRHYRIIKLNHRHENYRPMGKTGDIIVASHKNKEGDKVTINKRTTTSAMMSERKCEETGSRRTPRSHDRLQSEIRQSHKSNDHSCVCEDCLPGPSNASSRSPGTKEPTYCYQAANHSKPNGISLMKRYYNSKELISSNSSINKTKSPRLVVKKDGGYPKYHGKDETNLERYILLPTLVERTPSNIKRQKKFNELYYRILNEKLRKNKKVHDCGIGSDSLSIKLLDNPPTRDIGLNINITLSHSTERI